MPWKGGEQPVEDRSNVWMGRELSAVVLERSYGPFSVLGIDPRIIINSCGLREHRLGYTEDTWADIFMTQGGNYRPPKLVRCADEIDTACGFGQAAMGPFYCAWIAKCISTLRSLSHNGSESRSLW